MRILCYPTSLNMGYIIDAFRILKKKNPKIEFSFLYRYYQKKSQLEIDNLKYLKKSKLNIKYFECSPERFNSNDKFDVILNMEIIEHVENVNTFMKQSSRFLKKQGVMFIATLNQTLKSYLFAIIGAEYILRWLPIGTHEWEKFVKPEDLIKICEKNSLKLKQINGMNLNPITDKWNITTDKSVNYIAKFYKN